MAPHSGEGAAASRPLSVEQIVNKAQNFDYNPLIPLKYWLRTAGTLLKEVRSVTCLVSTVLIIFRQKSTSMKATTNKLISYYFGMPN